MERLRKLGAVPLMMELTDEVSIERCVQSVVDQTGGVIDVLINNAGAAIPGAVEDLRSAALRRQFEVNVFGTLSLTRAVLPYMRQQQAGRLIFLSSILAILTTQCRGAYCASKHALEAFIRALRMELSSTNISVVSIRPGAVRTQFRQNAKQQFGSHVDESNSHHQSHYRRYREKNFDQLHKPLPFSVSASEIAEKIIKVVDATQPKPLYYVTAAAHLMAVLSRILPERAIDWIMARI
jgi:NAD(P)-dependent dehydrogenase (short-subunit alcohol dehydrogenase family)